MNTSGKPSLLRHRNRKQERSSSGPEPTTGTQKTLDQSLPSWTRLCPSTSIPSTDSIYLLFPPTFLLLLVVLFLWIFNLAQIDHLVLLSLCVTQGSSSLTSFKHPHDNKSIGKGEEGQSSILYCLVCGANLTCVKSEKQTLRWAGQNLANRDSSVQWDRPGFTLISCTIYITKLDSECKQVFSSEA